MMRNKPMLAYPVSAKPIDYSQPVYIQPKLDGVRCLIQCDNGVVTAYSRTGKEWKNIDSTGWNRVEYDWILHPTTGCRRLPILVQVIGYRSIIMVYAHADNISPEEMLGVPKQKSGRPEPFALPGPGYFLSWIVSIIILLLA